MSDFMSQSLFSREERDDIQFEALVVKRKLAFQSLLQKKEQALAVTREIPLQLLALEWFNKIDASIETRAYLVENFLPILVLGCEKILKDAQLKHLIDSNKSEANFNPINLLAQYLMRNNPKYNNSNETSAYVRTMREVYQELREQMFAFQENKLSKVKADIRKRRNDREKIEKSRQTETNRRCEKIESIFDQLHVSSTGRIEISIISESINLYNEHISKMPAETKKLAQVSQTALPSYCFVRDNLNLTKRILRNEFVQCLIALSEHLSSEFFDMLLEFFKDCATYFVQLANKTRLNKILIRLFGLVDSTNTGLLTRRRIISVLEEFEQARATPDTKPFIRNPMEWPLLDPYIKFENKLDETQKVSHLELEMVDDQIDYVEISLNSEPAIMSSPKEEIKVSESLLDPADIKQDDEEVSKSDPAEISPEQEALEDSENLIPKEQTTAAKPVEKSNPKQKNKIHDEEVDEHLYEPIKTIISKDNELLFLNGGILYYKPLEQDLNAFDTSLLTEKAIQRRQSAAVSKSKVDDVLLEFNTDFLNLKQFLNLISNFIEPAVLHSEAFVNDLIVFLKNNYSESQAEKNAKLEKVAFEKKLGLQRERLANSFEKLDNEGSGQLQIDFVVNALENFKEGLFAEKIQIAVENLKKKIVFDGRQDGCIYKNEFVDFISDLISIVDFAKFEDQIVSYLNGFLQLAYVDKVRGETRKKWLSQIENVGELTFGSFEPLYKQLFVTILKDSETYGNNKNVSAYVSILETLGSSIGLRYHASTPYDSKYILGKTLTRETKNVTFNVIDESKAVHLANVRSQSDIHYFNADNQNDGSLLIYPLKYSRNKIFGTIGIDTLQETSKNIYFEENEIAFFQGVANTFAKSYAKIVFKNRMAKIVVSAIEFLAERCSTIDVCNVYIVQTLSNETMLVSEDKSVSSFKSNATSEQEKLNLKAIFKYRLNNQSLQDLMDESNDSNSQLGLKSHLYNSAMTSESTVEIFNSKRSFCFPIRNENNKAIFLMELVTKDLPDLEKKPESELEQIETILYVLDQCQRELLDEYFLGITNNQFNFENQFEQEKFEILFEKKYLKHVNDRLEKLSEQKVVELLADNTESPEASKTKEFLKLLSDLLDMPEFVKNQIINQLLIAKLKQYDPTSENFKFNKSQSIFDMHKQTLLKELHSYHIGLGRVNNSIRLLVDWVCLNKNMKMKCEKIIQNLK